ncbi:MAG: phosphoribosylformimino-5-aminoimidazole carboxamide ribotide isomerase [Stomatobaculum sp.]|nr:phosphoribosylformimino-5-aminoimidazole carboxamide ribotide isomerase [Stomatobaculum sp.]
MRFRPCIDIHNGRVKQIVGGSLTDAGDRAKENFVSEMNAAWYADLYRSHGLTGGHVILLNAKDSPYYEQTKAQALSALREWPGGLMIGGGISADNAGEFLDAGASHVIVTSWVFRDGHIRYDRIRTLRETVGKEHLVLDLSCRKRDGKYFVVTDRWQKFTEEEVTADLLSRLQESCDEFLIHAVDVEGKAKGIEEALVELLADACGIPATYAGGVGSYEDVRKLRDLGKGKVDVTIGSALDLFGGPLEFRKVQELFDI